MKCSAGNQLDSDVTPISTLYIMASIDFVIVIIIVSSTSSLPFFPHPHSSHTSSLRTKLNKQRQTPNAASAEAPDDAGDNLNNEQRRFLRAVASNDLKGAENCLKMSVDVHTR